MESFRSGGAGRTTALGDGRSGELTGEVDAVEVVMKKEEAGWAEEVLAGLASSTLVLSLLEDDSESNVGVLCGDAESEPVHTPGID